jgi:PPOX class probable F420-dependent enzyme
MALPDDLRSLFEGTNFAHVATILPDGSPHSVAVWTGLHDDRPVFFTQEGTRKARNLERDGRVAISITDRANPYRIGWVRGRVAEKLTGEQALRVIDGLARKYTGDDFPMRTGVVFAIEPERTGGMTLPFPPPP